METTERQGIQVIGRAASILRALETHPEGLSLGAIAKLVDLPRSTVQRIVDALDQESLVIVPSGVSGVRLGPGLLSLAAAARFEIIDLARPTLEALAKETGETVDLAIADHDKIVFVDQVPGRHRLSAVSGIGVSFPLHCSANGKAILSVLKENELARLKKSMRLTRHTAHTITSWDALMSDISEVRKSGIAYDREENSEGICAVAAAITAPTGERAAIAIPVPAQRFAQNHAQLAQQLHARCQALQQNFLRPGA
jgi:DNA-binding IclR family transcriptional regulator